jgi:hypothetical protein
VVKLFVEGGGDGKALRTECRQAISEFLQKAGLVGCLPRTVASGSRRQAYDDFCTAILSGEPALLLIDSEGTVAAEHQEGDSADWQPWAHLAQRAGDGWVMPDGAANSQCHLMVECMESWLLADRAALKVFFDPGFRASALPAAGRAIESVGKVQLYQALSAATSNCKTKAQYGKGAHSFKLLVSIDPAKVVAASPWAKRFVDETKRQMGC